MGQMKPTPIPNGRVIQVHTHPLPIALQPRGKVRATCCLASSGGIHQLLHVALFLTPTNCPGGLIRLPGNLIAPYNQAPLLRLLTRSGPFDVPVTYLTLDLIQSLSVWAVLMYLCTRRPHNECNEKLYERHGGLIPALPQLSPSFLDLLVSSVCKARPRRCLSLALLLLSRKCSREKISSIMFATLRYTTNKNEPVRFESTSRPAFHGNGRGQGFRNSACSKCRSQKVLGAIGSVVLS